MKTKKQRFRTKNGFSDDKNFFRLATEGTENAEKWLLSCYPVENFYRRARRERREMNNKQKNFDTDLPREIDKTVISRGEH